MSCSSTTQAPWRDVRADVALGQADGAQHRIGSLSLRNDRVQIRADARIGGDAPMPLALQLQASAVSGTPWQAEVNAEGPLANFTLRATLRGDARDAARRRSMPPRASSRSRPGRWRSSSCRPVRSTWAR